MKNIYLTMQKILKSKYIGYILIFILTVVIMAPIFTVGLTQNNDARIHLARILSIDSVIKEGVFPPIIDIDYMNGFGYALNLFYGPLTTYIPIILFNIFGTTGLALKIFTCITVFLSGITMYKFVFNVTERKSIATISALIYISAPYKLSNIYARGAVGEYTAFIFIPLVFDGIYNIINNKKNDFWLCIGIVGLVLSHTITTIYTALFAILFLIFNIEKLKKLEIFKKLIINVAIAFLICCFYAIPLLEHTFGGDYVIYNSDYMYTNGTDVYGTAIGFNDFFSNEFGNQDVRFSLGIATIFLTLLGIVCFKKIKKEYKSIYLIFAFLAFMALWMTTKYFPWFSMPNFFGVIQFAWRNLGFFAFFVSLICGINAVTFAEQLIKNETMKDTFLFAVVITICTFAGLGVMRNWNIGDLKDEAEFDKYMSSSDRIYVYSINREYLPINAYKDLDYVKERENRTYILSGNATIISEQKNDLKDVVSLENVKEGVKLELPYLYYLGYDVEVSYDGTEYEKVESFESENGFVAIELNGSDSATVKVEYKGTVIEKISYIISLIGLIILFTYIKFSIRGRTLNEKSLPLGTNFK